MSHRAPGSILQGTRWNYRILESVKGDNTHTSTVFKAAVVPREHDPQAPLWAFIKAASPSDEISVLNMGRECQTYRLPGVGSAECFRKLYDVIDDNTVALEWLDTTLGELKYKPELRMYSIIQTVLRAALDSCVVLEDHKRVNTDYKPANILLSGVKTDQITAKIGDLGLVPVGSLFNAQPYAMRAPEVFLAQACTEPSQVWAVAAMLLCWIKPGILGAWDSPHWLVNEAWCMAKIKRLFPNWHIPTPDEVEPNSFKIVVDGAKCFSEELPELQAILPFNEETQKVEMPQQLRDLLHLMLVTDPFKRPSASSILASAEFQAFEKLVGV